MKSKYEMFPFSAVENADGTPEFQWEEPQPNSEEATRLELESRIYESLFQRRMLKAP